ncbi:MAG: lysophospholipid acyltransferase family protein [Anaerolineales bacterium]|nr:lysophospholipid acyltransferase family protein [Anaerolineales bacterium]
MSFNLLYEIARVLVGLYSSLMMRVDIHWHECPPDGPKLYIANHPSATDPFMMTLLSRQQISVLVIASAFSFPLFGSYLRKAGQIPVFSGRGEQALEEARCMLNADGSIAIFPEGTYSPQNGSFHEPRSGAARLALKTGVTVIPVGIYLPQEKSVYISSRLGGTQTAGYWYWRGPYAITVGKPVRFQGDPDNKEVIQSTAQKMMGLIRSLSAESKTRVIR